ncbi:MAG: MarR family winged helix-turn-helix transcriptional regulator [Reyranella sp.]|uniref:MarR family winged helix-turn-helix transcriptional regulator n=1 Tax=Reyranella sp. TaxID=1929291 RepID=UPI00272FDDB0|nr:MarR family winged helix-turn-helix transcriptional regulator [Reyranella sp.]MDP1839393.1 MarR family winged helix-turn-helix transcriptional regulator [Reyranella sp.]MDP2377977.1 MarR family winged helix-turn-helix transcriptional regulator [Reyranella sp.]
MGPLDGYLPYLLNRAGARIATAFGEEVRPLGATLQTWRVLAALHERDGRRMGDLSETTSIEVSTLTRLVDNMEKKGLVARRRDAADARAVTLHATPAGRRMTRIILPIAERYEKVALEGFSETEATVLKTALRRLFDNMDGLRKS